MKIPLLQSVFLKILLAVLAVCVLFGGCSQPILEAEECIEARNGVKRFYSFHFGNDLKPSKENFEKRAEFLSENLRRKLSAETFGKTDYFTQTEDYPKAFRIGKCAAKSATQTEFEVLLFWRTNESNVQREIRVELVKEKGNWLINEVKNL